jgi:hypothetical protein
MAFSNSDTNNGGDNNNNNHNRRTSRQQHQHQHQSQQTVNSSRFYSEYHGHKVQHLEVLLPALRENCDSLIWTAGDSSLDNKYWFQDVRPAPSGAYQQVLDPPLCNADVTYWLNALSQERQQRSSSPSRHQPQPQQTSSCGHPRMAAINTAVEATTLNERTFRLRPQDQFLRDNIQSNDILVVSIGGNDVALAPLPCTIVSILTLVNLPLVCLEKGCIQGTVPWCDEYCYGCGPSSMLSCTCACPPCFGYMMHLFGTRVEKDITQLTMKTKPKMILVCMIYYPDEAPTPSWASPALGILGYNTNPMKLQTLIRRAFIEGTSKISIPGTKIIPIPLFNILDGKDSRDYVARVEPSPQGGQKMAEYILNAIERNTGTMNHHQQHHPTTTMTLTMSEMYGSTPFSSTSTNGEPVGSAYIMADRN